MTTIVEKGDSGGPAALLVAILIIFLIVGGIWFAYSNGLLGGKNTVIENNKTLVVPGPSSAPAAPKP